MGRERVLRTYGHHRQRRVLSVDTSDCIFSSSEDGSKGHLFSTSSSESGLGPSDSLDSAVNSSARYGTRRAKTKALQTLKSYEKNKSLDKGAKRKRQPQRKKDVLFFSEKDTASSSDCSTPVQKRAARRVLHDVSNKDRLKTAKEEPAKKSNKTNKKNPTQAKAVAKKDSISFNFSEFDDYSLIICDSPAGGQGGRSQQLCAVKPAVGTSTPCSAGPDRRRSPDLQGPDISYIALNASIIGSGGVHEGSAFTDTNLSPALSREDSNSSRGSVSIESSVPISEDTQGDQSGRSGGGSERSNLERLEESFVSLRVDCRRGKKGKKEAEEPLSQHSERSREQLSACSDQQNSASEDLLALECKNRVQRLRENLMKNVLDFSSQSEFDVSCSLFDSSSRRESSMHRPVSSNTDMSQQARDRKSNHLESDDIEEEEEDDSESDSGALGSEDLSAIVEDGGEESEDSDWDDTVEEGSSGEDYEDGEGPAEEGEASCSMLQDSVRAGSPVRYMLTSASCAEDLSEGSACSEGDSILCGKKSPSSSQRRSFAEILTPSKAKEDEEEVLSPRQKVLQQCGQDDPLPFTAVLPQSVLKRCVKVGEGVYGEVFRTKHRGHSVALKIIPIEGDFEVNDEPQKTFAEILPEIVISNELSSLREGEENNTANFCTVRSVSLVQGCYPPEMLKQWDIFSETKTSENDRPDMFGDDQLYIMFEFGDGGCDLDGCKLKNGAQAISVLQQVACALSVAEEVLKFEHRDLHVGNILVQPTHEPTVTSHLQGCPITVATQGIHVSIIDFTLSRLTKDGCTVFCDLASDDSLFEGEGDYQFDIYRMMKEENGNRWESYHPYTNVLWLHYLCDKLIHHRRFQITDRATRDCIKQLKQVYDDLPSYSTATHFVLNHPFFSSDAHS